MSQTRACTDDQVQSIEELLRRIAGDLSMIAGRELAVREVESRVEGTRPAGQGCIHVSFRFGLPGPAGVQHGCLLVPLPDAISLACCLMMVPEDVTAATREQETLDGPTKGAMLEVGRFICAALESSLGALGVCGGRVRFEGCQGVKPDVRPALLYREGDELIVGRARTSMEGYPEGSLMLVVPSAALGD